MRAIQSSPFGHPVPQGRGWAAPQVAYGAANRQQQINELMAQGYSRKEAREILNLDVGGGSGSSGAGWQEIIGGILDVGGQVVNTVQAGQQQARTNAGLDAAAGNLANQQGMLDLRAQQNALAAQQARSSANTAVYVVLGVGGLTAVGLLAYALTRK